MNYTLKYLKMNNIKQISFLLIIFLLLTSCVKKYTYYTDGYVYKDCSLKPINNLTIRLFNAHVGNTNEVSTITDSNGYFKLELNGEGSTEIYFEIPGIYFGPLYNGRIRAFVNDSTELFFNTDLTLINDTLYLSFHPIYSDGVYSSENASIYKMTKNEIQSRKSLKLNRASLLNINSEYYPTLYPLWIADKFDVYAVYGKSLTEYQTSLNLLSAKQINSTNNIKKIQLKSCLNSTVINL